MRIIHSVAERLGKLGNRLTLIADQSVTKLELTKQAAIPGTRLEGSLVTALQPSCFHLT